MKLHYLIPPAVIGFLGSSLLKLIEITLRWQFIGFDGNKRFWLSGPPSIVAFWHGQQLFMPWLYSKFRHGIKNRQVYILISHHPDGRMMASAVGFLGLKSIAGSSTTGGKQATLTLIDKLKQGHHIAITPDGPKGPPNKLKAGVIRIAQQAGAIIYPTAIAAERSWTFGSWDNMFLPKPFSHMVLVLGEPIKIPTNLTRDEFNHWQQVVESKLNELSEQAHHHWDK